MKACRKNESSQQREERLPKIRSYKQLDKGTNDESVEERNSRLEKQREYMKARRKNESSELTKRKKISSN
jgi:hypothetical protein